ncbi:MAG: hypothetical protein II956_00680 [Bacteroidales bacterium]|nr:hypothetical protein [Bacteroidales bacterium]
MVNNPNIFNTKTTEMVKCRFRFVWLLILTFLVCNITFAQDISERYISKTVGNDNVFFIKPHEIPAMKTNGIKNPLLGDFTISSENDSVAFLFTVYSKTPIIVERIKIQCYERIIYSSPTEKLFIVTEKNLYKGRYRCYLSKEGFKNLYSIDLPFVINLDKDMKFEFKKRKWYKEKQIITDIIKLIEINQ